MRRISALLALVFAVSLATPAFATDDGDRRIDRYRSYRTPRVRVFQLRHDRDHQREVQREVRREAARTKREFRLERQREARRHREFQRTLRQDEARRQRELRDELRRDRWFRRSFPII